MSYKTHLFICTNASDKPGKCGSKGSEGLRRNLKERCAEKFGKSMRVNASGCLGHCERGIAAVLYPKGDWFLDLTPADEDRLFKAVVEEMGQD
jgi:(2Fe-2S) ferredoxin